jgi:hypothetical protein
MVKSGRGDGLYECFRAERPLVWGMFTFREMTTVAVMVLGGEGPYDPF